MLVSTVGPFTRWGDPAAEAAVDAGATYFDSTGEPPFIRRVFEHFGPRPTAGCGLVTAFGFDWVPGNLAGALALRDAGRNAVRVEVGYFARGGGMSGGTQASTVQSLVEPSFAFRDGRLARSAGGARAALQARFGQGAPGPQRGRLEHFALPAIHPTLRQVDVALGMSGSMTKTMPVVSGVVSTVSKVPPTRSVLKGVLGRFAKGSTGGPDAEARSSGSVTVVAVASSSGGAPLADRARGPRPLHLHRRHARLGRDHRRVGWRRGRGCAGTRLGVRARAPGGGRSRGRPGGHLTELSLLLREAVRSGDFAELGELLSDDAVLDSSSERGRRRIHGREAIVEHLSGPGPGEVVDWDAREWDPGCGDHLRVARARRRRPAALVRAPRAATGSTGCGATRRARSRSPARRASCRTSCSSGSAPARDAPR